MDAGSKPYGSAKGSGGGVGCGGMAMKNERKLALSFCQCATLARSLPPFFCFFSFLNQFGAQGWAGPRVSVHGA